MFYAAQDFSPDAVTDLTIALLLPGTRLAGWPTVYLGDYKDGGRTFVGR